MSGPARRRVFPALVLFAAAALALGGCGRRGALETPVGTPPTAANAAGVITGQDLGASATVVDSTDLPNAQGPGQLADTAPVGVLQSPTQSVQVPRTSSAERRTRGFILDPLL